MSVPSFFFDEDVDHDLLRYLARQVPALDFIYVGGPSAPAKETPDRTLLLFAEDQRRAFITNDRNTIPGHVLQYLESGHHTWGVFICRGGFSIRTLGEAIILIWAASEAEEWVDRIEFIPW